MLNVWEAIENTEFKIQTKNNFITTGVQEFKS